jgi:hypothetical protein
MGITLLLAQAYQGSEKNCLATTLIDLLEEANRLIASENPEIIHSVRLAEGTSRFEQRRLALLLLPNPFLSEWVGRALGDFNRLLSSDSEETVAANGMHLFGLDFNDFSFKRT